MKDVFYTEYAVEINNDRGFVRQVDVFDTYEQAEHYIKTQPCELNDDEFFNIIFIDCNQYGDEVGFGSVV